MLISPRRFHQGVPRRWPPKGARTRVVNSSRGWKITPTKWVRTMGDFPSTETLSLIEFTITIPKKPNGARDFEISAEHGENTRNVSFMMVGFHDISESGVSIFYDRQKSVSLPKFQQGNKGFVFSIKPGTSHSKYKKITEIIIP